MCHRSAKEVEQLLADIAEVNRTVLPPFKLLAVNPNNNNHRNTKRNSWKSMLRLFGDKQVLREIVPVWINDMLMGFLAYGTVYFTTVQYMNMSDDDNDDNDDGDDGKCHFQFYWLVVCSLCDLCGQIFSFYLVLLPRKKILYGQSLLYIVATIMMMKYRPFSLLGRFAVYAVGSTLVLVTIEIFPTPLRATGHAMAYQLAKIGAIAATFVISYYKDSNLSCTILACVMVVFMIIVVFFTETKGICSFMYILYM